MSVQCLQCLALRLRRRRRRRFARAPATPGGEYEPEALAEVATDVVVDDGIHTAVGVSEAVEEPARHLVGARLGMRREIADEQVDMQRQPAHGEDDDDDEEDARRVLRALVERRHHRRRVAAGLGARSRRRVVVAQEAQHEEVERRNDEQRQDVGEDEEGKEETAARRLVLDAAVVVGVLEAAAVRVQLDAVDEQRRQVAQQHGRPDDADRAAHVAPRAPPGGTARKHDREVAHDGDEDERVHRHVDRHVEQELRQLARNVAERPVVGGEMVGDEGDAHDEEEDITEGEVQQQQVDGRAHLALGADDEDHHAVADAADNGNEAVECRDGDLVEPEIEGQFAGTEQFALLAQRSVVRHDVHDEGRCHVAGSVSVGGSGRVNCFSYRRVRCRSFGISWTPSPRQRSGHRPCPNSPEEMDRRRSGAEDGCRLRVHVSHDSGGYSVAATKEHTSRRQSETVAASHPWCKRRYVTINAFTTVVKHIYASP